LGDEGFVEKDRLGDDDDEEDLEVLAHIQKIYGNKGIGSNKLNRLLKKK
jgi:hypothetical protein